MTHAHEQLPANENHGGHELFDVHEVLSTTVAALNQMTLFKPHIQCQQLLGIVNRQYAFMVDEHNIAVEAFKTGKPPSHPTKTYMMEMDHQFQYGTEPKAPTKPIQSTNELNDEVISGFLLGNAKNAATGKVTAALETCNPVLRRVLADSIPNCIEMAYELSIYQNKHQYYEVPQLKQYDMQNLLNSFAPTTSTS